MTDLAAQILAALDRAEETAQAATPGPEWDYWEDLADGRAEVYVPNGTMDTETILEFKDYVDCEECHRPEPSAVAHIAANDPAHVLRLTTALREVVKLHGEADELSGLCAHCDQPMPCAELRALASVWDVPGDNT
jgi:hypothetical protein